MRETSARYIIGIDEAGRGPLAGPVTVGAVLLPRDMLLDQYPGGKDSKRMSVRAREEWFERISKNPSIRIGSAHASHRSIDTHGIVESVRRALHRAIRKLDADPNTCHVVLDGLLMAPPAYTSQETIVKGDSLEIPIMLASIVAKVTRDRLMQRAGRTYPEYGFERHKGYATPEHIEMIRTHGLSDIHRESYCTRLTRTSIIR